MKVSSRNGIHEIYYRSQNSLTKIIRHGGGSMCMILIADTNWRIIPLTVDLRRKRLKSNINHAKTDCRDTFFLLV